MPCTWIILSIFLQFCLFFSFSFHVWFIFHGLNQIIAFVLGFNRKKTLVQLLKVNVSVCISVGGVVLDTNEPKWNNLLMAITRHSVAVDMHAPCFVGSPPLSWQIEYICLCVHFVVASRMMTLPMQWNFKHGQKRFNFLPPTLNIIWHSHRWNASMCVNTEKWLNFGVWKYYWRLARVIKYFQSLSMSMLVSKYSIDLNLIYLDDTTKIVALPWFTSFRSIEHW